MNAGTEIKWNILVHGKHRNKNGIRHREYCPEMDRGEEK